MARSLASSHQLRSLDVANARLRPIEFGGFFSPNSNCFLLPTLLPAHLKLAEILLNLAEILARTCWNLLNWFQTLNLSEICQFLSKFDEISQTFGPWLRFCPTPLCVECDSQNFVCGWRKIWNFSKFGKISWKNKKTLNFCKNLRNCVRRLVCWSVELVGWAYLSEFGPRLIRNLEFLRNLIKILENSKNPKRF
jgi:hypothetical protein